MGIGLSPTCATALVVDDGHPVVTAEHPIERRHVPGGVEQSPDDVLRAVVAAGRTAVARAGGGVDVVGLAQPAGSVLVWDPASGRPLSNVLADPGQAAPKMAWLRRTASRDGLVTTADAWLVHQLTGEYVTDAATASRTGLVDLDGDDWNRELLDLFGLADERLPAIVANDAVIGSTVAFGDTALVGGLTADRSAALLGTGCLDVGAALCTFGGQTRLAANVGPTAIRSGVGLATSVAWRLGRTATYGVDGQSAPTAAAVRWMKQLGYISTAADIDTVAADDAHGVLAVPAFGGLGPPWRRPDATASIRGMTSFTTVGHLVTAILQGVAAQVAELAAAIATDLDRPLTRLRVRGALTRCRTLMQAVSDLMQIEVEVEPAGDASALGAAALARRATGPSRGLAELARLREPEEIYRPCWSADRAGEFRHRWTAAATSA